MNTQNPHPIHTLSKHTSRAETIALARYAAVSWVHTQLAGGLTLQQALRGAVERRWNEHRFALSSLERYFYAWRRGGFDALHPKGRSDRGRTTALSVETQQRLMQLRREHPQLTVSVLIKQLLQEGLLQPGTFSLPSIYRYLARIGLDARTLRACGPMLPGGGPTKAFETALANDFSLPPKRFQMSRVFDCNKNPGLAHMGGGSGIRPRPRRRPRTRCWGFRRRRERGRGRFGTGALVGLRSKTSLHCG